MRASLRGGCGKETHIANHETDFLNRLSDIDYNMLTIAHQLMTKSEGTAAGETQTFIGRKSERARLVALVERERAVAIVGAAGVGKSALA
ncbi:MAG: ATP-binding protein, partial [Myxococcales bacterium]|nr:ATP-binding protein [Myxococcales bacterium]